MKQLSTLCVLAMPMLLSAQSLATDSTRHLNEFVVSAKRSLRPASISKIEAPLAQIPITVSTLTAEELGLKGYTDATEALREVPGVHSYRQYGAFHMFFIRGFYESLVLNDGMRDDRHTIWQSAPLTGLASIERIEVLKGAASMQQGHSAVGGVVNLVRKQPEARLGANARISYGSYNTLRIQAGATGAVTDRLLLRGDVEAVRSDGWRENYTKGYNLSLMAKYLFNSKSDLQLSLYANNDRYGGDYGIPYYASDAYRVKDNSLFVRAGERHPQLSRTAVHGFPEDELAHKNLSAHLKYEYRFSRDWRLSEQLFLSSDDIRYMSTDYYGWATSDTPQDNLPYYILSAGTKKYTDLNTLERGGFAFDYSTLSLQNQLELVGKVKLGAMEHNLLLGYNYLRMGMKRYDRASMSGVGYSKPITLLNPVRNQGDLSWVFSREQKYADQTHGIYAQDYLKWGKLALLAGLRLDYFRRDFTVSDTEGKTVKQSHGTQSLNNLALTYRAGLVYSPTESLNLYASASNFYKPQKIALSSEVAYLDKQGNEMGAGELSKLPPMRGHQFELGTHISCGKSLSLDASLYYLSLNNKLNSYLGKLPNGKRRGALVDGYESKGAELSIDYRPIDALGLQLAYAYTDARVKASSDANAQYVDNNGHSAEHSPKHRLNAWAFWSQSLSRHSRLRCGLGTELASYFYTSESNKQRVPGYTIFNAVVAYEWRQWGLQLNVSNLLDADYSRHVLYDYQYLPAEGRNMTLSLSYRL
ncbi:MAG: TonB-dependent receptor [Porphyromonas sp.]|nr:TonB-dependent receptor [Porphyromonas sp.]